MESYLNRSLAREMCPAELASDRRVLEPPRISPLLGLLVAAILAAAFSLAAFGDGNPPPVGPGSGRVGSMTPGIVGSSGYSDMGNGETVDNLTGDLVVTHPVGMVIPLEHAARAVRAGYLRGEDLPEQERGIRPRRRG